MEDSHLSPTPGIEPLSNEIRLTDLDIAGSRITDAGLDHLASLTALWRLRLDRSRDHRRGSSPA